MKQKVVIEVSMFDKKSRKKALQIAVSLPGVEGVTFQGEEKKQLAITGEGFDAVLLTGLLRKRFERADLVSYGPVEEKAKEEPTAVQTLFWPYAAPHPYYGSVHSYVPNQKTYDRYNCSTM